MKLTLIKVLPRIFLATCIFNPNFYTDSRELYSGGNKGTSYTTVTIILGSFPMKETLENYTAFYCTGLSYEDISSPTNAGLQCLVVQFNTYQRILYSAVRRKFPDSVNLSHDWILPNINLPQEDSLSSCSPYNKGILRRRLKVSWASISEKYQNNQIPENMILKLLAPPHHQVFPDMPVFLISLCKCWAPSSAEMTKLKL